jgi:hypothetical protein
VNKVKNLINTGQLLGRSEMKKIMAGSGSCMDTCQNIAHACFSASAAQKGRYDSICRRQFQCCAGTCMNYGC